VSGHEHGPDQPGARLHVVGGGDPTSEELAAIVVALTPTGGGGGPDADRPAVPAWTAAALSESVGGPAISRPSDLVAFGSSRS
jgi:hypothetical protein